MYSVVLEVEVLFILVMVVVLSSMLQKQFTIQSAVSEVVIYIEVQFLVVLLVVLSVSKRMSTVKQGILYWTCTGLAVEVIGLVPTRE